eukprot:5555251-Amphidinium_carterae.1
MQEAFGHWRSSRMAPCQYMLARFEAGVRGWSCFSAKHHRVAQVKHSRNAACGDHVYSRYYSGWHAGSSGRLAGELEVSVSDAQAIVVLTFGAGFC